MSRKRKKKHDERAARWGLAGLGFAVLAAPVAIWGFFDEPAGWAAASAGVCLTLGIVCWVVATIVDARAEQVSGWRVIGRTLSAPFRYLYHFMV
ncbi:hypothetical protein [Cellulomonas fengjieae]|uniref:hypothetical protein n=1 Tax=Cellulomonas fengjieae TaxID=2819978 RepID=UPI001AAEB7A2|nr:hypothetical protein [Cellulomonas fengjieae]MBO3102437.1 hypothetical protein [Cellulomonas fengjieae]